MGLLKKKDILIASDFANHDDPFYADNLILKTSDKNELPGKLIDVVVAKSLAVFFTVDNILNKLIANDKFIALYLEKILSTGVSKTRATQAFKLNVTDVTTNYFEEKEIEHINVHHTPTYSSPYVLLSTVYTSYMHTDFSNIDVEGAKTRFLKTSSPSPAVLQVSSDVLISCEFDDSPNVTYPTNYVNVQVMNEHTGRLFSYSLSKSDGSEIASQVPSTADSKYIYKEWLSGLKELLIYVPTTFSFYNGALGEDGSDPHSLASWIRVVINRRHFKFLHIYGMYICGLSFPLQISASSDPVHPYFNDCPLPSIARSICFSSELSSNTNCVFDENTSMYTLYFCSYGTDALAILIFGD